MGSQVILKIGILGVYLCKGAIPEDYCIIERPLDIFDNNFMKCFKAIGRTHRIGTSGMCAAGPKFVTRTPGAEISAFGIVIIKRSVKLVNKIIVPITIKPNYFQIYQTPLIIHYYN